MKRKIKVLKYNPEWPKQYLEEIKLIKDVLSSEITKAHHIGSTAVPSLAAKPVIDILLEVKNVSNLDKYNSQMERIGYIPKGEFGIPDRRFFLKGEIIRTHHIHAFNASSYEVKRHLAFRDFLRTFPQVANEYGILKIRNAKLCNDDINKYCELKNEFVKHYEQKALEWYDNKE